jgi:hypothetical protein
MKYLIVLLLLISSCTSKLELNKTYLGSPEKQSVIIKSKYKNGIEVKRHIINKRVKLHQHKVEDVPEMPNIIKLFEKKA